ncbi:hypothetical protein ACE01N_16320 [Saccharicrinis sp. FJH2]|uniref:hypothetical protein n=1 Tax=Saccharicrinis sp. FJH65 TaxID=3344659 RepID=UPI0035F45B3E
MRVRSNKLYLLPYIFLLFFVLNNIKISGQDNLLLYTTKVTINAQNTQIREILSLIERNHNIVFSYKDGLFNDQARRTFIVKDMPLYNALDSLLQSDSLSYYPLGRNVVIYRPTTLRPRNIVVRDTLVQNVLRKDTVHVKVLKRDTVIVFKTDTLFDTIYVKDPYPVYDTLYMDKPKIQLLGYYNYNFYRVNRTGMPDYLDYSDSLFNQAESNPNTYRIGLLAQVNLNEKFYFKTGLGFGKSKWNSAYNFRTVTTDSSNVVDYHVSMETEVYKTDSIFIYFPGSDTLWFYDYDTVYHYSTNPEYKKDTTDYKYSGKNELMFLSIPFYMGWEVPVFKKSKIYGEVGLIVDFLLSTKGMALSDSPYGELVPLSDLPLSPISAYMSLGIGFESPLSENLDWFVKFNYDWQLNSDYAKIYPVRQRRKGPGFSLGIKF